MTAFAHLRGNYLNQPREVSIETQAFCNARCTFCPYPTLERIGERMADETISRLIEEMATFRVPFFFSPFKVNEPLLDKRLVPICEAVNDRCPNAALRIFTNGSALTDANAEGIGRLRNVAHLWVSLNSHKPDEYEALMGLPFERTAARLDALHASRFPHPVMLSCVGYPNEDFRRYCFDRWPNFDSMALQRGGWLGAIDPDRDTIPDTPCARWFELSIMATGVVSLCCMDGSGQYAIGDITKQTMREVYNAPHWRERREQMLSRRAVHPCNTCTM